MNTIRNTIEMSILGYTVYSDKENWSKTINRLLNRWIFYPIKVRTGIGKCEACGKIRNRLIYRPTDAEPNEDGGADIINGYVCEECDQIISEKGQV